MYKVFINYLMKPLWDVLSQQGLGYFNYILCWWLRPPQKKEQKKKTEVFLGMSLNYLVVELQFWRFQRCEVILYSQVHSNMEW